MRYVLEFSTINGDALGNEPWSLIESNSVLPVPNVGDRISLQGNKAIAEVVNREMSVYGTSELEIKFQVFCRETPSRKSAT